MFWTGGYCYLSLIGILSSESESALRKENHFNIIWLAILNREEQKQQQQQQRQNTLKVLT